MANGEEIKKVKEIKLDSKTVEAESSDVSNGDSVSQIDGGKATKIAREYLEQNFGNVGMLYYRVEELDRNGDETQFYVTCSILSAFGSKERLYYKFRVNISDGHILEVWRSKPSKEDGHEIELTRIKFTES